MLGSSSGKNRILEAARRVFAARGANDGTLREICALAKANVALVKYHFGNKEHLYTMVLDSFLNDLNVRYPFDDGVTSDSPPQDKLKAFIRAFFNRLLGHEDPVSRGLGKLIAQEMFSPSSAFEPILEKHIRPNHEGLVAIVGELWPGVSRDVAVRCAYSISGQCVVYEKGAMLHLQPSLEGRGEDMERLVEDVTEFSLGGIERLKQRAS
ncbi:CerR family C-terminal domain-containing protein [Fundidesulfovibrio butyratiphilus]